MRRLVQTLNENQRDLPTILSNRGGWIREAWGFMLLRVHWGKMYMYTLRFQRIQSHHLELIKNSKTLGNRLYYQSKTNSFKNTKGSGVSDHSCNGFKASAGHMSSFLKKKLVKPNQCQDIDSVDYTHLNISYSNYCKTLWKARAQATLYMQKFCFRVNLGSQKIMGWNIQCSE